jgi:hypothetical protein
VFGDYILFFPFNALYITETRTEAKHNLQRYIRTFNLDTLHSALSKQSIKIFYFLMQKAKVDLISVLFETEVKFLCNFQHFSARSVAKN